MTNPRPRGEACPRCIGTGVVYGCLHVDGGRCFQCSGSGVVPFGTLEAMRLRARNEAERRRFEAAARAAAEAEHAAFVAENGERIRAARAAEEAAKSAAVAAEDALSEADYTAFCAARDAWAVETGARGSYRGRFTVAHWRGGTRP